MKDWKCKCGCGGEVRAFRHDYIHGHGTKGYKHTEETKLKMRKPKGMPRKNKKKIIEQ